MYIFISEVPRNVHVYVRTCMYVCINSYIYTHRMFECVHNIRTYMNVYVRTV